MEFLFRKCTFSSQSPLDKSTFYTENNQNFIERSLKGQQFSHGYTLPKSHKVHTREEDQNSLVNSLATSRISQNFVSGNQNWGKDQNVVCQDEDETYYTTSSSWMRKEDQLKFGTTTNRHIRKISKLEGQDIRGILNKITLK